MLDHYTLIARAEIGATLLRRLRDTCDQLLIELPGRTFDSGSDARLQTAAAELKRALTDATKFLNLTPAKKDPHP